MTNRYEELLTSERALIDNLINTMASTGIDKTVMDRIIDEAQTKIREEFMLSLDLIPSTQRED